MNAMQLLTGPFAQAIGWALLHLLWQATIVAALLAATLALIPRVHARARYAAAIGALSLLFALFAATAIRAFDPAAAPITIAPVTEPVVQDVPLSKVPAVIAASAVAAWRDRALDAVVSARQSLPTVVALWFAGVLLLTSRLGASWLRARRLMRNDAVEASREWQEACARIANALGVTRAIRLLESSAIEVPAVIGAIRPVVLLPVSTLTGLTPQQIEMILAHELAHVRRHDFIVNLLQALAETLMFHHPAVWWISHTVRVEREHCCDDLALSVSSDRLQYAQALARLEELRSDGFAVAVAANGGSLLDRVRRIAGARTESTSLTSRWVAAVAMLTIVAMAVAVPSFPLFAQKDAAENPPSSATIHVDAEHADDVAAVMDETLRETMRETVGEAANESVDEAVESAMERLEESLEAQEAVAESIDEAAEELEASLAEIDHDFDYDFDFDHDFDFDLDLEHLDIAVPAPPAPPALPSIAVPAPPVPAIAPLPPPAPLVFARNREGRNDEKTEQRKDRAKDKENDRERRSDGKLSVDELIALRAVGVTPDYVRSARSLFPGASLHDITQMRAVGVTEEAVRELRSAGLEIQRARDAVSLVAVGVQAEFVRSMRAAGLSLDTKSATSMSAVGVSADYVRAMRDAGVAITRASDAVSLKAVGVTPELVRKLAAAGYTNLSARELTRMAAVGIDDDFIRDMEQYRSNR